MATEDPHGRVRRLTCCCCGAGTRGRQWPNRDTGFGVCSDCAEWVRGRETPEEHRKLYGVEGIHYSVPS